MNDTQDLTVIANTNELIFNQGAMKSMMDLANFMASAKTTIPAHLKGSPADCMAIIMQSAQFRMNPFAVAQKTFLVNGVLGYEAQLISAVITNNGPVTGRFYYEFFGDWTKVQGKTKEFESKTKTDDAGRPKKFRVPAWTFEDEKGLGVIVSNTIKGETEPRKLTLYLSQALTRNSTQWSDDAQQQLSYLAVKKWARRYCPDVIMGVYSPDELEETALPAPTEKIINPTPEDLPLSAQEVLDKIKANPDDNFNWIDSKAYSKDEKAQFRAACSERRKQLAEAAVVSTQQAKAEPEPETKPGPQETSLNWPNAIMEAGSTEDLKALEATMSDAEKAQYADALADQYDFLRGM